MKPHAGSRAGTHTLCVCILAHNEEKNIQRTIHSMMASSSSDVRIRVYANGCTDDTIAKVTELSETYPNVEVREIAIASKANAWNIAFSENPCEYLIFTDGDIIVPPDGIAILVGALEKDDRFLVASSRQLPFLKEANVAQKAVGFMQLPLKHEYICGGFYAVRRCGIEDQLCRQGFKLLPSGLVGEDRFLQLLVGNDRIIYPTCYSLYEPPDFHDYCRYLARLKWQNKQLQLFFDHDVSHSISLRRAFVKMRSHDDWTLLPVSVVAVFVRYLFKFFFSSKIETVLNQLGPAKKDASTILNSCTRSQSVK